MGHYIVFYCFYRIFLYLIIRVKLIFTMYVIYLLIYDREQQGILAWFVFYCIDFLEIYLISHGILIFICFLLFFYFFFSKKKRNQSLIKFYNRLNIIFFFFFKFYHFFFFDLNKYLFYPPNKKVFFLFWHVDDIKKDINFLNNFFIFKNNFFIFKNKFLTFKKKTFNMNTFNINHFLEGYGSSNYYYTNLFSFKYYRINNFWIFNAPIQDPYSLLKFFSILLPFKNRYDSYGLLFSSIKHFFIYLNSELENLFIKWQLFKPKKRFPDKRYYRILRWFFRRYIIKNLLFKFIQFTLMRLLFFNNLFFKKSITILNWKSFYLFFFWVINNFLLLIALIIKYFHSFIHYILYFLIYKNFLLTILLKITNTFIVLFSQICNLKLNLIASVFSDFFFKNCINVYYYYFLLLFLKKFYFFIKISEHLVIYWKIVILFFKKIKIFLKKRIKIKQLSYYQLQLSIKLNTVLKIFYFFFMFLYVPFIKALGDFYVILKPSFIIIYIYYEKFFKKILEWILILVLEVIESLLKVLIFFFSLFYPIIYMSLLYVFYFFKFCFFNFFQFFKFFVIVILKNIYKKKYYLFSLYFTIRNFLIIIMWCLKHLENIFFLNYLIVLYFCFCCYSFIKISIFCIYTLFFYKIFNLFFFNLFYFFKFFYFFFIFFLFLKFHIWYKIFFFKVFIIRLSIRQYHIYKKKQIRKKISFRKRIFFFFKKYLLPSEPKTLKLKELSKISIFYTIVPNLPDFVFFRNTQLENKTNFWYIYLMNYYFFKKKIDMYKKLAVYDSPYSYLFKKFFFFRKYWIFLKKKKRKFKENFDLFFYLFPFSGKKKQVSPNKIFFFFKKTYIKSGIKTPRSFLLDYRKKYRDRGFIVFKYAFYQRELFLYTSEKYVCFCIFRLPEFNYALSTRLEYFFKKQRQYFKVLSKFDYLLLKTNRMIPFFFLSKSLYVMHCMDTHIGWTWGDWFMAEFWKTDEYVIRQFNYIISFNWLSLHFTLPVRGRVPIYFWDFMSSSMADSAKKVLTMVDFLDYVSTVPFKQFYYNYNFKKNFKKQNIYETKHYTLLFLSDVFFFKYREDMNYLDIFIDEFFIDVDLYKSDFLKTINYYFDSIYFFSYNFSENTKMRQYIFRNLKKNFFKKKLFFQHKFLYRLHHHHLNSTEKIFVFPKLTFFYRTYLYWLYYNKYLAFYWNTYTYRKSNHLFIINFFNTIYSNNIEYYDYLSFNYYFNEYFDIKHFSRHDYFISINKKTYFFLYLFKPIIRWKLNLPIKKEKYCNKVFTDPGILKKIFYYIIDVEPIRPDAPKYIRKADWNYWQRFKHYVLFLKKYISHTWEMKYCDFLDYFNQWHPYVPYTQYYWVSFKHFFSIRIDKWSYRRFFLKNNYFPINNYSQITYFSRKYYFIWYYTNKDKFYIYYPLPIKYLYFYFFNPHERIPINVIFPENSYFFINHCYPTNYFIKNYYNIRHFINKNEFYMNRSLLTKHFYFFFFKFKERTPVKKEIGFHLFSFLSNKQKLKKLKKIKKQKIFVSSFAGFLIDKRRFKKMMSYKRNFLKHINYRSR